MNTQAQASQSLLGEEVLEGIWRLSIPQSHGMEPFADPVHVYLCRQGSAPAALVNTGPAGSVEILRERLAAHNLSLDEIQTIVITGVWPDLYGALPAFPKAKVRAAFSAKALGDLAGSAKRVLSEAHALIRETTDQRFTVADDLDEPPIEALFGDCPRPKNCWLRLAPDEVIELGARPWRVMRIPGALRGAMGLYSERDQAVFAGELLNHPIAPWIHRGGELLESLRQVAELHPEVLLTNRATMPLAAEALLRRAQLFLNTFMTNIAQAMDGPTSAAELVARDLTLYPAGSLAFSATALGYSQMLQQVFADTEQDFSVVDRVEP